MRQVLAIAISMGVVVFGFWLGGFDLTERGTGLVLVYFYAILAGLAGWCMERMS